MYWPPAHRYIFFTVYQFFNRTRYVKLHWKYVKIPVFCPNLAICTSILTDPGGFIKCEVYIPVHQHRQLSQDTLHQILMCLSVLELLCHKSLKLKPSKLNISEQVEFGGALFSSELVNKSEIHSLAVTMCCVWPAYGVHCTLEIHQTHVLHLVQRDNRHQTPIIGLWQCHS